ncbi:unnamed protein product, partial [Laminaria digitata]
SLDDNSNEVNCLIDRVPEGRLSRGLSTVSSSTRVGCYCEATPDRPICLSRSPAPCGQTFDGLANAEDVSFKSTATRGPPQEGVYDIHPLYPLSNGLTAST